MISKLLGKIKDSKGFTLVELLVVISIMGILTVIIAASFAGPQRKSRDVERKANLATLAKALNMYYADYGRFPENLFVSGDSFKDIDDRVYMKTLPEATEFQYVVGGQYKDFKLFTYLENNDDSECIERDDCISYGYTNLGTDYDCCYAITSSNIEVGDTL